MRRWERTGRIFIGLLLLGALCFVPRTPWAYVGFLGVIPLFSAITGECVLCRLLGWCRVNTSGKRRR
ncbi:MAG: DUF2892 domain-containing protein [Bacillota bacterium]|nr:DUF2892 domain-containing protein [Bacillota bacterium]